LFQKTQTDTITDFIYIHMIAANSDCILKRELIISLFILILIIGETLFATTAFSQTKAEIKASKKMFEGRWVNKKEKRHLTINYEGEYAEINDWHGKMSEDNNTIDAYKAWVKAGKLVMPESKTDLRCPYCEIVKKGDALLYRCMGMYNKDKRYIENTWFVREKR